MSEYTANKELKAGAGNNASRNRARTRSSDARYPAARIVFRVLVGAAVIVALHAAFGGAL